MSGIVGLLVVWLVTAASLLIISKLPLGVEIDSIKKALLSAAVFGVLNATLGWLLRAVFNLATLLLLGGVVSIIVNILIFGISAMLIQGFRLRWGVWSAVLGGVLLGIINSLLLRFLPIAV
jgi:putative membrane protein